MPRVKHCGHIGCHLLVEYPNKYCAKHQSLERDYSIYNRNRNRNDVKSEQYSFYRTKQWVNLRQAILDEQHYLCQYCLASGIVKPAKVVDHIVPVEFDSTIKTSPDNLATICTSCHTIKTKWEQSYYGTGLNGNLKNVNPVKNVKIISNLINKVKK